MSVEIDHDGAAEVLMRLAAGTINDLAKKVADDAGEDAVLDTYTTDRAAASVSVPAEQQAKDGVLTRAAVAAGLELRLR